ncbi:Oligosaccharide translocation protein rft1 [Conoideocrella luteorostrata]|uniref:Man(5)GlcNAc(2)-PP-dolichol translocation protein RFT1 n=1 Tax=Conoideocrella luteorostrata TaxID=1105319 RepID=A0AAJ0D194_9HYPO|nr:Oligosaccharide translocation protein rft1 [Conoideocrella luteorostrata]
MPHPKTSKTAAPAPLTPSVPQHEPARPSMVKGASLLILLQLISRLVTFIANQLLLRFLTAPLLGLSTQLEVYYLSVLFFARESLRVAIQRQGTRSGHRTGTIGQDEKAAASRESQAVVNLGYLAIVIGVFVSTGLGWMYLVYSNDSTLQTPYLTQSVYLYGTAAMIELLSEPCFVLMQTRLQFGTRATAESVATFSRCIVVFGSAVWASRGHLNLGVLPFALGQLTYGTALLLVYFISGYGLASTNGFSLLPRPVSADEQFFGSLLYRPTMRLAASMMAQSVVKHLLTQGDTFLISLFSTPQIQGTYALANNYGGLLARLLFQPVEESSRSYFSSLLAATSSTTTPAVPKAKTAKTVPAAVQEAKQSFQVLTRLYVLLSAIIVSLGPFASPSLIAIVAGARWSKEGAGDVLGVYCFYVPFLALNGLTESFVASVASEAEVHIQSIWMGAFSLAFAASSFIFMSVFPLGAQGLVLANIINMLCRIVWSFTFIKAFFRKNNVDISVKSLVPGSTVALALSTLVVMHQLNVLDAAAAEPILTLAKIAASAIPLLLLITFLERQFLLECFQSIRGRKSAKQK